MNVLYKSVGAGFIAFSAYAMCNVIFLTASDPSEGREYTAPKWPPPPEQRSQKHPKWMANRERNEDSMRKTTDAS